MVTALELPTVIQRFRGQVSDLSGAELNNFGSGLLGRTQAISGQMTKYLTLPLLAMVGAGADLAVKFQSQMEQLRTQAGATQVEVNKMSQAVLTLAPQVGQGPQALADALYHIESAGYRGSKALSILKAAAQEASVGHANLTDVTNALDAAIVSGIPGVQNYQQAVGALNATVGAGDMTMQDLADALGTGILASAKAFGLSIQDVGAALATLGDNNIRGARAATQLRMALSMIGAPSPAAVKALNSMGLNATQLADDMRKPQGLLVALQDLQTHLNTPLTGDAFTAAGSKAGATAQQIKSASDQIALAHDAVTAAETRLNKANAAGDPAKLKTAKDQLARAEDRYAKAVAASAKLQNQSADPTKIAALRAQLEKFGLTGDQVNQMISKIGPNATEQALLLARAFGGGRTSGVILTLLNQIDRLQSKYGAVAKGSSTFGDSWKATTHTAQFELKALEAGGQAALIRLGFAALPVLQQILHGFMDIFNWVAKLPPGVKRIGGELAIVAGIAGPLLLVMMKMAGFVEKVGKFSLGAARGVLRVGKGVGGLFGGSGTGAGVGGATTVAGSEAEQVAATMLQEAATALIEAAAKLSLSGGLGQLGGGLGGKLGAVERGASGFQGLSGASRFGSLVPEAAPIAEGVAPATGGAGLFGGAGLGSVGGSLLMGGGLTMAGVQGYNALAEKPLSKVIGKNAASAVGDIGMGAGLGATIGSVVPVLGTGVGAAVGAGLGGIYAERDHIVGALHDVGTSIAGMWHGMFGGGNGPQLPGGGNAPGMKPVKPAAAGAKAMKGEHLLPGHTPVQGIQKEVSARSGVLDQMVSNVAAMKQQYGANSAQALKAQRDLWSTENKWLPQLNAEQTKARIAVDGEQKKLDGLHENLITLNAKAAMLAQDGNLSDSKKKLDQQQATLRRLEGKLATEKTVGASQQAIHDTTEAVRQAKKHIQETTGHIDQLKGVQKDIVKTRDLRDEQRALIAAHDKLRKQITDMKNKIANGSGLAEVHRGVVDVHGDTSAIRRHTGDTTQALQNLPNALGAQLQTALSGIGPQLSQAVQKGFTTSGLVAPPQGQGAGGIGAPGSIPHRAGGGPVVPGQAYWVGEDEPELFSTGIPGYITPRSAVAGLPLPTIPAMDSSSTGGGRMLHVTIAPGAVQVGPFTGATDPQAVGRETEAALLRVLDQLDHDLQVR